MPTLDCLIDAGSKGRVGYTAFNNSTGEIKGGAGIINMGAPSGTGISGSGIFVTHCCRVVAALADSRDATGRGAWITRSSSVMPQPP